MRMILLIVFVMVVPLCAMAQTIGEVSGLPIPRFVSMRGDQVYARTGPGTRYPIEWVYQRKDLPVEVIQEFDTWRKIRDRDGEEGWVHLSLLSGKRHVIVGADTAIPLYKQANDESRVVALVESGAILKLLSCDKTWCEVSQSGYKGWIPYDSLWGVYEGEQIE